MTSEIYVADRDNIHDSIFDEMDDSIDSIMRDLNAAIDSVLRKLDEKRTDD